MATGSSSAFAAGAAGRISPLEFSLEGLRSFLQEGLAADFTFISFQEAAAIDRTHDAGRYCVLRHDVDASLDRARRVAEVESEVGVRSTFFLMLRSPVYNLFSRRNTRLAERILALGHEIGLHFDASFTPAGRSMLAALKMELSILEDVVGRRVEAVSLHQPSAESLADPALLQERINTYSRETLGSFHYVSDSNMVWRDRDPRFEWQERTRLQFLLHPMWWCQTGRLGTEDVWDAVIQEAFEQMQLQLLETERAFGRRRSMEVVRTDA